MAVIENCNNCFFGFNNFREGISFENSENSAFVGNIVGKGVYLNKLENCSLAYNHFEE